MGGMCGRRDLLRLFVGGLVSGGGRVGNAGGGYATGDVRGGEDAVARARGGARGGGGGGIGGGTEGGCAGGYVGGRKASD